MIDEIIEIDGSYVLKSEAVASKALKSTDDFIIVNGEKSWVKNIRTFDKGFDGSDRREVVSFLDEKGEVKRGIEVVFFKSSIYCLEQFLDNIDPSICLHKDVTDFEGNNQKFFDWYCPIHESIHDTSILDSLNKLHRGTKGGARKGAGRPAPNGAKTTMSVRIPKKHKEMAAKMAADSGISISELIERLIDKYND